MTVKKAVHINRTVILQRNSGNMVPAGASLDSDIIDFKDMLVGWIQVWYKNVDNYDSSFELFVSAYPDADSFCKYPDSLSLIDEDCNGMGWNIQDMGFRYAFLRYYKGPTVTTGDMEIVAVGKKG